MRAIHLTGTSLTFRNDVILSPDASHIPVRVLKAGICETDLQLVQGYMGFQGILGHEFVGIATTGKYEGQRVVGEINCACRQCERCLQGLATHCPHRTVLGILKHDGAFAETVWLPEENLHPIPDSISNDAAVFVEPLAAAFQISAQLDISLFKNVLVLGDGRLGNLCAQVLALQGCDPLVIGKHTAKLDRLKQLQIRTQLLQEQCTQSEFDLVVDCTGSANGFADACRFVKPRGTIVLKTTVAGTQGPNLAPVVIDEITVLGSRCGPFAPAIQALADKKIEVESLVTGRFRLEQVDEAFSQARAKGQMKILLEITDNH